FFPDGRFMRIIGGDELALPFGLAIDKAGHRLFVVDHKQADVVVYSEEGKFLKRIGGFGAGAGEFNRPTEIAYENGMLYVLDSGNARFEAFDSDGQYEAMLPFGDSRLPMAFTVDTAGRLYCVDGFSLGVLVLDATGDTLTTYGVRRPYGQPAPADQSPTYKSLIRRADGAVLGLRADLTVDVLELNVSDVKVTAEESGNR
ncbi:MAG TPA: 6-bladed beta-propeller, partial [Candidatus Saccharimonadales bacterium]|nr:6-bladed beta-propeller [Candidatus Saccharimonadales bacterium]